MKRIFWALAFAGAMSGAASNPARAQNVIEGAQPAARTIYVYNAGAPPTAKLGAWGNGDAASSQEYTYNGDGVVKIRSRNFYEGARFDLTEPIDLEPYKRDGYLRLRLRFKPQARAKTEGDKATTNQPLPPEFGGDAAPPGFGREQGRVDLPNLNDLVEADAFAQFGQMPAPNAPRPGGAGMPPLGGNPRGGGGRGGGRQQTTITRLRLAFQHDQGVTVGSTPVSIDALSPDAGGWRILFFPLREMRSTADVQGLVRRVVLSTDNDDTIWLAQLALVIETGKMRVAVRRASDEIGAQIADVTAKPGPLALVADVESGIADPIIEWNFDADNVGNLPPAALSPPPLANAGGEEAAPVYVNRIDARGLQATYDYPNEEQNYRVEVTVRDRTGKKTPVKASLLVRVRG